MPPAKTRIALIGNFYPFVDKSGPHTVDLCLLLCRSSEVESVRVYGPAGANLPSLLRGRAAEFQVAWIRDDPISLLGLLLKLAANRRDHDLYVFDTILTNYGNSNLANAAGLILPGLLRLITRKSVVVYCQSYLETQDPSKIGFKVGPLSRFLVHALEGFVLRTCRVVVPLAAQQRALERAFQRPVAQYFLPYLDAIYPAISIKTNGSTAPPSSTNSELIRVLFFGTWGPQKDLTLVKAILDGLARAGILSKSIIAGSIHSRFPEYRLRLEELTALYPDGTVVLELDREFENAAFQFINADIIALPYAGSGGLSGVLQHAALFGRFAVTTDLPEMREQALRLAHECVFFSQSSGEQAASAVIKSIARAIEFKREEGTISKSLARVGRAQDAVDEFLGLVSKPDS
jgi:hypothetical protein